MTIAQVSGKQVKVTINADPGTEVIITNSRRDKIKNGAGLLDVCLNPGLYKVFYKAGGDLKNDIFEVADQPVILNAPPLKINTPIPLSGSTKIHEYQEVAAKQLTQTVLRKIGLGSEFALFARDSSKTWDDPTAVDPSVGLQLKSLSGSHVLDISKDGIYNKKGSHTQVRAELDPGTYLLTLSKGLGEVQLPIVLSPRWRTIVFIDSIGNGPKREPDIYDSSVVMNRVSEEFQLTDETLRYAELARYSLEVGRASIDTIALTNEILQKNKINYPMLGILLGHLMLIAKQSDLDLLKKLEQKLEETVPNHPDVLTLRIALAQKKVPVAVDDICLSGPPMLRSSWDILVEASANYPSLLPDKAEWMQYTCNLSGSQGWLAWQRQVAVEDILKNIEVSLQVPSFEMLEKTFLAVSHVLRRGWAMGKKIAGAKDTARAVLAIANGEIDCKQLIKIWQKLREALSDPVVAKNPLQNALRRKLLTILDDKAFEESAYKFSLKKFAQDMRVPVAVLINNAKALYVAAQEYKSNPPEEKQ